MTKEAHDVKDSGVEDGGTGNLATAIDSTTPALATNSRQEVSSLPTSRFC